MIQNDYVIMRSQIKSVELEPRFLANNSVSVCSVKCTFQSCTVAIIAKLYWLTLKPAYLCKQTSIKYLIKRQLWFFSLIEYNITIRIYFSWCHNVNSSHQHQHVSCMSQRWIISRRWLCWWWGFLTVIITTFSPLQYLL